MGKVKDKEGVEQVDVSIDPNQRSIKFKALSEDNKESTVTFIESRYPMVGRIFDRKFHKIILRINSGSVTLYIDCEPTRTIKMRPKATGILVGGNTLVGSSNFNTDNQLDVQTLKIYCEVPSADDNEMGCCDIPGKEKAEFCEDITEVTTTTTPPTTTPYGHNPDGSLIPPGEYTGIPKNCTCPAGPEGPQGEKGDAGADGMQGYKGEKGRRGKKGWNGLPGQKGGKGDGGSKGKEGPRGATGPEGPKGSQGAKGDQGVKGNNGMKGSKGEDGNTGKDGKDGIPGVQGSKGETGQEGFKGTEGERGPAGEKGESGDTGPKGSRGRPGRDGREGIRGKDGKDGIPGFQGSK